MSRYTQKGSTHVVVVVVLIAVLLGALGFIFWQNFIQVDPKKDTEVSTQPVNTEQKKETDVYEGWISGNFNSIKLSYKVPSDWQNVSATSNPHQGYNYEEAVFKSPDGFVLNMKVHNLPRGFEGEEKVKVLDFKQISDKYQWVINNEVDGTIRYIYVTSRVDRVGQETYPVMWQTQDGLVLELVGYFVSPDGMNTTSFATLTEFSEKDSVKKAKLVLESLSFK